MLGHQKWSSSLVEQDCSWQEREEGPWPQRKVKTSTLAVPTVLKNIYLFHFLLTSRHPLFWFVVYFLLHLGCLETLPGDHFRSAMLFQTSTYSFLLSTSSQSLVLPVFSFQIVLPVSVQVDAKVRYAFPCDSSCFSQIVPLSITHDKTMMLVLQLHDETLQ